MDAITVEAIQVYNRLNIYANELFERDYDELRSELQIEVIAELLKNKVITKSPVNYL